MRKMIVETVALAAIVIALSQSAGHTQSAASAIPVDLELVLAVDTSASVDNYEYNLQMHGLVQAFRDPVILSAIRSTGSQGIAVTLVHWSSANQQAQIVPWTQVNSEASARAFSHAISLGFARQYSHSTGIGSAMRYGERLIRRNAYEGRRKSIDVSGDGTSNSGAIPSYVRQDVIEAGVTINGLAILNENPFLDTYFARHVIGGSGAFVMTVASYEDIAEGMKRKLLREISASLVNMDPGVSGPAIRAASAQTQDAP